MAQPLVGVLALQGDFEAHTKALRDAGAATREVRSSADLAGLGGLVLPGGESTTMLKLLHEENLFDSLRQFGKERPMFGTCAGAILLASEVLNPAQESLGLVDMTIERNAYGRQVDSRIARIDTPLGETEAVFIRAPIIRRTGKSVEPLAAYLGHPVLVKSGRHLISTFHPELSRGASVHQYFLREFVGLGE